MVIYQSRSKRKPSGGRLRPYRKKRQYELGRRPSLTKIGEKNVVIKIRTMGNNEKNRLVEATTINLLDPKTKKYSQAKLKTVLENPANRHFVRRNIMTKGTIVETDKGKAKILSRPGQDGVINAVLYDTVKKAS